MTVLTLTAVKAKPMVLSQTRGHPVKDLMVCAGPGTAYDGSINSDNVDRRRHVRSLLQPKNMENLL